MKLFKNRAKAAWIASVLAGGGARFTARPFIFYPV